MKEKLLEVVNHTKSVNVLSSVAHELDNYIMLFKQVSVLTIRKSIEAVIYLVAFLHIFGRRRKSHNGQSFANAT